MSILEENSDNKFDFKPSKYLEVSALLLYESKDILKRFLEKALTIAQSSERPLMLAKNELRYIGFFENLHETLSILCHIQSCCLSENNLAE